MQIFIGTLRSYGTVIFLSTLCLNFERTEPYCHPWLLESGID